jgi:hemoglobin-like flavoprotein
MDPQLLKDNFALVASHGEDVAAYFYADLFERDPALRAMFPGNMDKQRQMLLSALSHVVSVVDDPSALVPYLRELGLRHRGYGVTAEHFPAVGASLLATLRHYSGRAWSPALEEGWAEAYTVVSQVMQEVDAGPGRV